MLQEVCRHWLDTYQAMQLSLGYDSAAHRPMQVPHHDAVQCQGSSNAVSHLHRPEQRNCCRVIDDTLPKNQRVQQRVVVLLQHLQHSNAVCGSKDDAQRQTVLQEQAGPSGAALGLLAVQQQVLQGEQQPLPT